jgi:hypothetical protein
MSCLKDVPTLRGDNYTEWRKKVDLGFVCAEVDWVVDTPQLVKLIEPVRDAKDDDASWDKKKTMVQWSWLIRLKRIYNF